jgi:hypothetical protein
MIAELQQAQASSLHQAFEYAKFHHEPPKPPDFWGLRPTGIPEHWESHEVEKKKNHLAKCAALFAGDLVGAVVAPD